MTKARTLAGVVSEGSPLADGTISAADVDGLDASLDTKLPLAGGTMTGPISFAAGQTWPTFNQSTTGSAATLATGRTIGMTGDVTWTSAAFNGSANVTGTATLAASGVTAGTYTKVTVDAKGRATSGTTLSASDIPNLDASKITTGTLDAARLPSYVDDVLEYANLAAFPASGETGKIYVALDTNKTYRWSGSSYVYITSGAVDSVAGKTGVVTLTSSDVGLGNVENKSSATIRGELTSGNVTGALGFTPYNSSNPSGFISGITSGMVTTALGYTPLNKAGDTISGAITSSLAPASINTTTPGLANYGFVFNGASSTDYAQGITWTWSNGGSAQAGIYVQSSGAYGTKMYLATTDSFATGAKTAVSIDHTGAVNIVRGALTQAGNQVLHAGNYTSYSPSLTGSGASGTWGISITGNAATAYGLAVHTGRNNEANKVVRTDGSGYIQAGWINTTSGDNGTTAIDRVYASSDGYIRYYTPANFRQVLDVPTRTGGSASGTWGISVTGSAGSVSGLTLTSSANGINPDNVTQNQLGYNTSVSLFGQSDGGLYSSAYSSSWIHQIYGDFRTGQIAIRGKNSGTWQSWRTVLDSSNYTSYAVGVTNNSTLNSDTRNTRGVTRLYRRDDNSDYSVQTYWTGSYWRLYGYNGDSGHADTQVGLADRATRANGNFYIDDNYGCGIVGVYTSTRYQGVFAMGDSYKLPADGTTTGSLYGMAWSHPNAGGVAGNLDSHGMIVMINGGFGSCMSYSIKASGNVTAYSDERLKTNWRSMPTNYVARLAQVKVGIYDRTDNERLTQVGVSAQSFQELLPQAITVANDEIGTLSVSYGNAALASAVELAKDNVELRARIERLEALVEQLLSKE